MKLGKVFLTPVISRIVTIPIGGFMANLNIPDRIQKKVIRVPFSTCWYWIGTIGSSGYGHAKKLNSRQNIGVHRLAYEAIYGEIPEGKEVDHICCTRTCVNPDHLELVTHKENMTRAAARRKSP